MGYNYNFSRRGSTNSSLSAINTSNSSKTDQVYAKVLDVILDSSHIDYSNSLDIGKIKYQLLDSKNIGFADPFSSNVQTYPIPGEIVELVKTPTFFNQPSVKDRRTYYKSTVNLFNQSNENKFENNNVLKGSQKGNMLPLSGDVLIQGRFGQSIRMSGMVKGSEEGEGITIIKNGQQEYVEFGFEDVNTDDSSIYLTSNHQINIKQGFFKNNSYNSSILDMSSYKGKQILFNSDRIGINSKKDDILLSAPVNIGLMSKTINIEGELEIGLDANKIFLGKEVEQEPAVLGNKNKEVLDSLIQVLSEISNTLVNMEVEPDAALEQLRSLGVLIQQYIDSRLRIQIPLTLSKKVFIDSGK
jgi:hypothetical protein